MSRSTSPVSRTSATRFSRTSRRWIGGSTSALTATPMIAPSAACASRCPTAEPETAPEARVNTAVVAA
ncbi:hypothetical protein SFUMM280S_10748 [Streptomyces fumanus]